MRDFWKTFERFLRDFWETFERLLRDPERLLRDRDRDRDRRVTWTAFAILAMFVIKIIIICKGTIFHIVAEPDYKVKWDSSTFFKTAAFMAG